MSECSTCLTVWGGLLVLVVGLVTLRASLRRPGALVAPVGLDVTAHDPRPVPPVVTPERAQYNATAAGIWGPDILTIPHTIREFPRVNWQGQIEERRN